MLVALEFCILYQWVRAKKFAQPLAQCACSMSMDYAYPDHVCQRCFVQELVHSLARLLDRQSDHVDLARCAALGRLSADGNIFTLRRLNRGLPLGLALYSCYFFHRPFHS